MTRIALISDIHASEVALRAVLAEIRRTGVDQVICLGDVATLGPRPNAVIEILGELGCRCIMGNHDEFLIDAELVHTYTAASQVVANQLDPVPPVSSRARFFAWLRAVLRNHAGEIDRAALPRLPRSHVEDILACISHSRWRIV